MIFQICLQKCIVCTEHCDSDRINKVEKYSKCPCEPFNEPKNKSKVLFSTIWQSTPLCMECSALSTWPNNGNLTL